MLEFEVKILDINVPELEDKLRAIGAKKIGDFHYRTVTFDYPGFPLDKDAAWVRLRDEGDKVTLAYKRRLGVTSNKGDDKGMEEVEFEVGDFEIAKTFLLKIGLIVKFAQEKKRTRYSKDGVDFDIDTWPRLKPYLEIEGESHEAVKAAMKWLNIPASAAKQCSATQVYEMNGIRDKDYIEMTFERFVRR